MSLIQTYFTDHQLLVYLPALSVGVLSILCFSKGKVKPALILLFLSALTLRLFTASLDPFLHIWDEQFHALVAKNMVTDPFSPKLYATTYLDYNYQDWTKNHIWLHKQPLFLWQIALSFKILGVSEFSLRIPSAIMCSLLILFIYRIGAITSNKNIGYLGALLYTFAFYQLELTAGKAGMDHNDAAFLFYVTASIWSWLEFNKSNRIGWALLAGLFSGAAVLNKWLVGLLVFAVWGLSILYKKEQRKQFSSYFLLGQSLLIAIVIFLPWQIYTHIKFPMESSYEMMYNAAHFTQALEGHSGNWTYYITTFPLIYGKWSLWLILPSIIILFKKIPNPVHRITVFGSILIIYLFFGIAQTKLVNYPMIVAPLIYLAFASLLAELLKIGDVFLPSKMKFFYFSLILISISWINLNTKQFEAVHTSKDGKNEEWLSKKKEATFYRETFKHYDLDVIINTGYLSHIPAMFYSGKIAYPEGMSKEHYQDLRSQGLTIAVIQFDEIPSYIQDDKQTFIVKY